LVIRLDLLGDLVLSLPAIHALARSYPDAAIDALVTPATVGVIQHEPAIARVMSYDPTVWRRPNAFLSWSRYRELLRLLGELRHARYDLCLSLAGEWASLFAYGSQARRRVGYRDEAYPCLLTDPVAGKRYRTRQHEVEYGLALARAAGASAKAEQRAPALTVSSQAAEEVRAWLADHAVRDTDVLIALHAGATNGAAKRWPVSHWAALADRLIRELHARVVLTGAPSDAPLTQAIMAHMQETALNFAGKTTIPQLAALLARCDLVMSGDSGPLHMAGAVGTPVVALYGPTDPLLSGPAGKDATVLRLGIWCSPCYDATLWAECRFFNPVCMKALLPDDVFAAARSRLAQRIPQP
jgi:lipopolysaccharide heptosyltransferase II